MTKNNFLIITGGPGAGKSTILNSLADLGYKVVAETARLIIKERISKGLTPRPDPDEFAQQIFDIDLSNYINNINSNQPIFFDRSLMDSAAMIVETNKAAMSAINETLNKHRFNQQVFIAPPWKEIYRNDSERDQTYEESVRIYHRLYDWYRLNNYTLTEIPKTDTDSRIHFILQKINELTKGGE